MEILETFKNLREKYNYNLELTIVSPLRSFDHYAVQEGADDVQQVFKIIHENNDWIKHFPKLPNGEVLAMMKAAHIGLLPTYADSYGYSVLEMQAAGCPVITTNIRALPENNDNQKGWLIEVPKDPLGEAIYTTAEGRQAISAAIRLGLERVLHEIFANRSIIMAKAENAMQSIKVNHSVQSFAARMRKIYQEALNL
jgi:glycosyltransferase involved in cell wall biosynthesis